MARICVEMRLANKFPITVIRAGTRRPSVYVTASHAERALPGRRCAISLGALGAQLASLPKASALIPANDDEDEQYVLVALESLNARKLLYLWKAVLFYQSSSCDFLSTGFWPRLRPAALSEFKQRRHWKRNTSQRMISSRILKRQKFRWLCSSSAKLEDSSNLDILLLQQRNLVLATG